MKKHIRKLLIILLIFLCINIAFDAFFFFHSNQAQKQYDIILNDYIAHEEDTFQVSQLLYKLQSLTLSEVISTDESIKEHCRTEIASVNDEVASLLESYRKELSTPEQQNTFEDLYSSYNSYLHDQEIALQMEQDNSTETAHYYVANIMGLTLTDMNQYLDTLYNLTQEQITDVKQELSGSIRLLNMLLVIFVSLSIVLIVVILIFFTKLSGDILLSFDKEQQEHRERVMQMQSKTIENMAELVENRDGNTGEHIRNTAYYVDLIARQLAKDSPYKKDMTPEYIELLKQYAPLHDVGKIVVPDAILLKPGRLTPQEFDQMKKHTTEGGRIIDSILSHIETEEHIAIARNIAACHHEKWDGSGYPQGLSGEDIPLEARIMSVADVFDALISKRCYKEAFTLENAYQIITDSIGSHFDPVVANAFLALRPVVEEYLDKTNPPSSGEVAS